MIRTGLAFQSTRPRGARPSVIFVPILYCRFNPRAHAGRDRSHYSLSVMYTCFNPRAHAGRDSTELRDRARQLGFQSTRPRGARLRSAFVSPLPVTRFNPRAHAGRDLICVRIFRPCTQFQSTRPRGARLDLRTHFSSVYAVSIHAPTRGATRAHYSLSVVYACFNPRAHAGRDSIGVLLKGGPHVSIHAPTRGATV